MNAQRNDKFDFYSKMTSIEEKYDFSVDYFKKLYKQVLNYKKL